MVIYQNSFKVLKRDLMLYYQSCYRRMSIFGRDVFRILTNIHKIKMFVTTVKRLKVVNYFRENLSLRWLTGFSIRLCLRNVNAQSQTNIVAVFLIKKIDLQKFILTGVIKMVYWRDLGYVIFYKKPVYKQLAFRT